MTAVYLFLAWLVGAWMGVGLMAVLAASREPQRIYMGDPSDRYDEGAS